MSDDRIKRLEAELVELCLEKRELQRQLAVAHSQANTLATEYHNLDANYKHLESEHSKVVRSFEEYRARYGPKK